MKDCKKKRKKRMNGNSFLNDIFIQNETLDGVENNNNENICQKKSGNNKSIIKIKE